jgi:hypothetical protein
MVFIATAAGNPLPLRERVVDPGEARIDRVRGFGGDRASRPSPLTRLAT